MVRIMTDNAANLPPELREQYNIRELRLTYTVDGRLIDGSAPFDGHDFYEAMRRGAEVKTSMISPAAARDAIEPALAAGDDVLFLGISGGVSGTCWGVGLIAQERTAGALRWARAWWCWRRRKWPNRARTWIPSSPVRRRCAARCGSTSWWTI